MLNDNIRFARKQCGYTQQQVSDFLGIKRSSYAYYETGHSAVPVELIPRICVAFGVSADWLLSEEIVLKSNGSSLMSKQESKLPGLANLTARERSLLLLLRKHELTEEVMTYAVSLIPQEDDE